MADASKFGRRELGEILLQEGSVSPQSLERALSVQRESGRRVGSILVEMGALDADQLFHALAKQRQEIPEISGSELHDLPADRARLIPETLARRFNVVALSRDGHNLLTIAMEDPTDLAALDLLSHVTGCRIEPVRAQASDIASAIDSCYGRELTSDSGPVETEQSLEELTMEVEHADGGMMDSTEATELLASAEETPVVKFVEALFRDSVEKRASDVHVEPGEQTTNVRIRVDGVLQRLLTMSGRMHAPVVSRIKILSGMNIAERRLPQDGRCRLKLPDHEVDVRVSTLPMVYGEKIVMRLLDKTQGLRKIEDIGATEYDLGRFREALQASYGMILLSGPTGSGKTTSLYAALNHLNEPTVNIVTVEDPVEYQLAGIGQVQVKPGIGLSFATCLRHILRQDPNVIMLGEMRDLETAQIAVRAALTGHLVLSTLHANNAPAVVSRLLDIGIAAYLITASLNLAVTVHGFSVRGSAVRGWAGR